jgi:hypothetical protein
MLKKNQYLFIMNSFFFKKTAVTKHRTPLFSISLRNSILNISTNLDFSDLIFFKKNVFVGIAISLVNWERFKKVSNLSLNNIYWQFVEGYSFFG